MDNKSNSVIISSIVGFIINILSAYLFSLGLIDLTAIIVIIIGFIIFIIITGFQSKVNEFETKLSKKDLELKKKLSDQDLELKKINERLKINEQLIDIKSDIKELQRYLKNGKK